MSSSAGKAIQVFHAFLLLCLLRPGATHAEVLIEPRIGFRGLFQLGHPFPLEVELSNSDHPIEGVLEVQVWRGGAAKGGSPYPLYYRKEVFLGARSRKSVQLTIDPTFVSRPLTMTFVFPGGRASRETDLRGYFSAAPLMLLVGESGARPAVPLGSASLNRLVSISLPELPPDPRALLGVSTIFVYDQSLRELSRSQAFALETWVARGGKIVILASLNTALYQEANISRFLPVRVTGVKKIAFPAAVRRAGGARASPLTDIWAQDAKLINGRIVIEEQGSPILVEAVRGRGRVVYLALDIGRPPLSDWNGLPGLLNDVLLPTPDMSAASPVQWDEAVFLKVFLTPALLGSYVPTVSLFVALTSYVTAVCLFAWLWYRRRLRRRTMINIGLSLVACSTFAGYFFFSRSGSTPDAVLMSSTLVENVAEGYAEAHSNIALFSTQHRRFDMELARGWIELVPVTSRLKQRDDSVIVVGNDGSHRLVFPLREWDYRLLKLRFTEPFPLHVSIQPHTSKFQLKVSNQTAKDLTDCWLVIAGQRFFLGDIGRGESWTKEFSLAANKADSARGDAELRDIRFPEKTREVLFHWSFFPRDWRTASAQGDAVFFGWIKHPSRRVWIEDPRIWAYDYALFRMTIALPGEDDT